MLVLVQVQAGHAAEAGVVMNAEHILRSARRRVGRADQTVDTVTIDTAIVVDTVVTADTVIADTNEVVVQ